MLIISNGAFKSGSTWLYNLIYELTNFPPPPQEYLEPSYLHPSIQPGKLSKLVHNLDIQNFDYLVKNHFKLIEQREMLLSSPDIRIINIKRDIPDVIVSAYYHHRIKNNYRYSFSFFYYSRGRYLADKTKKYHKVWDLCSPQIYVASYENLIADFLTEVEELSKFLGRNLSQDKLKEIQLGTTINKLREKYVNTGGQKEFFRKGIVGDWKNYFSDGMTRDISNILQSGLSSFDHSLLGKMYYRFFVSLFLERKKFG